MIQRPVLAEILKKRARLSKAKKVAGVKRKGAQAGVGGGGPSPRGGNTSDTINGGKFKSFYCLLFIYMYSREVAATSPYTRSSLINYSRDG